MDLAVTSGDGHLGSEEGVGVEQAIRAVLQEGVAGGVFAGGVVHVVRDGVLAAVAAAGHAQTDPVPRLMTVDTRFDMASLTKVMATLPAILRSVQAGRLTLDTRVGDLFPAWNACAHGATRSAVTVRHLLTHTSGLPAWRPYYLRARSADQYRAVICAEPLDRPPGAQVVYSDPGFMLLGFILEAVWDTPLAELCARLVFAPLSMAQTRFGPLVEDPSAVVAATERGNPFERRMCEEYVERGERGDLPAGGFRAGREDIGRVPWRTEVACKVVNDGNAFYGLQGISGHAGLFSTAADTARYLSMWAQGGEIGGAVFLDPSLVQEAIANLTPDLNIARGLGFETVPLPGTPQALAGCSGGPAASPGGFGHTGFTGTSLWYDPVTRTQAVALTNRVHPVVRDGIAAWRHAFYRTAFSGMGCAADV